MRSLHRRAPQPCSQAGTRCAVLALCLPSTAGCGSPLPWLPAPPPALRGARGLRTAPTILIQSPQAQAQRRANGLGAGNHFVGSSSPPPPGPTPAPALVGPPTGGGGAWAGSPALGRRTVSGLQRGPQSGATRQIARPTAAMPCLCTLPPPPAPTLCFRPSLRLAGRALDGALPLMPRVRLVRPGADSWAAPYSSDASASLLGYAAAALPASIAAGSEIRDKALGFVPGCARPQPWPERRAPIPAAPLAALLTRLAPRPRVRRGR